MSERKIFGTDGIRGMANKGNMTADMALKVGMAAGSLFTRGAHRHRVVIGKDTRLSGYLLEPALTAGFISVGMDVILVGPMPTPAVSMLTRSLRADIGVMISASHNPYYDNGIKLFGPDGYKLSDEMELAIEQRIGSNLPQRFLSGPDALGRARRLDDAQGRYIEFIKNTFPKGKSLEGLKIVIDCANGAAYHLGPTILWELGAEVIPLGVMPDGFNINAGCGSNYPEQLSRAVLEHNAHLGIALDGDADRLIVCDEKGKVVDGDQLMALIATSLHCQNLLKGGGVVATVMSNLGLEYYLQGVQLHLKRTQVGDRYVMEAMRKDGYNLGGEQSGHIILSDYTTTGDGLLAALQILAVIVEKNRPASEVCNLFAAFPQVLRNVSYTDMIPLDAPSVIAAIKAGEEKLRNSGRVLIRKSGTEPLVRVMAEGQNLDLVNQVVNDITGEMERVVRNTVSNIAKTS
jgi:phosphoglucosamine mutase